MENPPDYVIVGAGCSRVCTCRISLLEDKKHKILAFRGGSNGLQFDDP